jgi:DNA-binding NtrC family response regulator
VASPKELSTLTTPGRALGHVLRAPLELSWLDEGGEHRVFVRETSTIGSAEGTAVRIRDPAVSRVHAELSFRPAGPFVRDLGSHNGTWVEGLQVEGALLPERATLRIGRTVLEARLADPDRVMLWPEESFGPLLGATPVMRELFARLSRVARSEATTLVVGETGTGKELAARAIHEASARKSGPFVTVDCTSVPESLFESELFGHAKGSFTGATAARTGAIEAADGGTLFLDEIGELPVSMQPKLLRALEQKSVRRVGESSHRPVDVRFVAATHQNLAERVGAGTFREDLYFRIAVLLVEMPPLRARAADVPLLASRFDAGRGTLTPDLLAWIVAQPWRGNVRELRNFLERTAALGERDARALQRSGPAASPGALPAPSIDRPFKEVQAEWMAHLEREYVRGWLARTNNNLTKAAEAMGLNRTYVHRLVKKHDLDR